MNTDDKFMHQLRLLKDEKPPEDLYTRIMTVVPNMAQVRDTAPAAQAGWVERFFGEWRYGLSVKLASLVILAVLGFCVGHLNGLSMHQDRFITDIITGDFGWED